MLVIFHLFDFDENLNIESHDIFERVPVDGESRIINEVLVDYLVSPAIVKPRYVWFNKDENGNILDECTISHYGDSSTFRSFIVITCATPHQEWDAEYDSYTYAHTPPDIIEGYEDKYLPIVDVAKYHDWLIQRQTYRRAWGLGVPLSQIVPEYEEGVVSRDDSRISDSYIRPRPF